MTRVPRLPEADLDGLNVLPAGAVNLRRDLYWFVSYVRESGLTRSVRENAVPKTAARRLARLLSWAPEAELVERQGRGVWSDYVSHVARDLGVVEFAVEGVYRGESSMSESFPDNEVRFKAAAWQTYLRRTPREKERALLDSLIKSTPNEFFLEPSLVPGEAFAATGSAIGPASRIDLPKTRRSLLQLLAKLEPGVWYEMRGLVELVHSEARHLILDPATRQPDPESMQRLHQWEWDSKYGGRGKKLPTKPESRLEDIYTNFREFPAGKDRYSSAGRQITESTADAFLRVEGRYLEWFLREIPYVAGFIELAARSAKDRTGLDVSPPLGRLRGVRVTDKLLRVLGTDPELNRVGVTVLPNFEVLVDAPSYPEAVFEALLPYAALEREDGPVLRFRLDRRRVLEHVAGHPEARPEEVLARLSGRPVPENVEAELRSWCGHIERLTFFDDVGLVEVEAGARERVRAALGDDVVDDRGDGFLLIRKPGRGFNRLEEALEVPARIRHGERRFDAGGALFAREPAPEPQQQPPAASPRPKVRLQAEDLVGYRSNDPEVLRALRDALAGEAATCLLVEDPGLLVISSSALPQVRAALRRLAGKYDVEK